MMFFVVDIIVEKQLGMLNVNAFSLRRSFNGKEEENRKESSLRR